MKDKKGVLICYGAIDPKQDDKLLCENIKNAIRTYINDDQWNPEDEVFENWYSKPYINCGFRYFH